MEGLRTDSLYLFDWTFMGAPIRVSQALSIVLVLVSACVLVVNICLRRHDPADLLVNRVAAREAAEAEGETTSAEEVNVEPAECRTEEQEERDNGGKD